MIGRSLLSLNAILQEGTSLDATRHLFAIKAKRATLLSTIHKNIDEIMRRRSPVMTPTRDDSFIKKAKVIF